MAIQVSPSTRISSRLRHVRVSSLFSLFIIINNPFLCFATTEIIKLILTGKMSQAIEHTLRSYPGLLENNKNLWFALKCRQFIEMINGADVEVSWGVYPLKTYLYIQIYPTECQ